jgi:hypothetical protein
LLKAYRYDILETMKLRRREIISLFGFLGVILFFFQANILAQKIFCFRDIGRYYYPSRFFVTESLSSGYFPFWNPYISCGYPSFASLQQATFYPLTLLHQVFPFFTGFNYFFIAHFLIGGLGAYLLLRKFNLSQFGSLTGALCFAFNGYFMSMLNILTTLSSVAWLPWALLCFKSNLGSKRPGTMLVITTLILIMQFFAGQPEIVFLTLVILLLYLVYYAVAAEKGAIRSVIVKEGKKLLLVVLLFILATAVQLVPFLEIIRLSIREAATAVNNTVWSFHPLEAINFIIPSFSSDLFAGSSFWFGQGWLRSGYLGIIVLLLLAFSWNGSQPEKKYLLLIGVLGLLLAFGKYLPGLYWIYEYIPGLNAIRYPVKYLVLFYFAAALLAAFGAEAMREKEQSRALNRLLYLVLALAVMAYGALMYGQNGIYGLLEKKYFSGLVPLEKYVFYHQAPGVLNDIAMGAVLLILLISLLFLRKRGIITGRVFKGSFIVLLIGSLAYGTYQSEPVVAKDYYTLPTENTWFLKDRLQRERIYLTPKSSSEAVKHLTVYPEVDFTEEFYKRQKVVLPNLQVVHHLFALDGYESIKLKNNEHIINLIASRPLDTSAKYLDLLGVKYLLSFFPIKLPQFTRDREDYISFYRNRHPLRRLYLFDQARFVDTEGEMDLILDREDFDPLREVLITGRDTSQGNSGVKPTGNPAVSISNYENNRVVIQAFTPGGGWLVLADTFYPGWQATINGASARIYQADYMLRAVRTPAGNSEIVFDFRPTFFIPCLFLTLLAYFSLSAYFIYCYSRSAKSA